MGSFDEAVREQAKKPWSEPERAALERTLVCPGCKAENEPGASLSIALDWKGLAECCCCSRIWDALEAARRG